eukprot:GHUV01056621.1.p3 GENE.GHUV01056621.1~~GHUV01056621.1.p3  ORF type:complete len:103 (+),score=5.98 GHUV01056621.1:74-382(+)
MSVPGGHGSLNGRQSIPSPSSTTCIHATRTVCIHMPRPLQSQVQVGLAAKMKFRRYKVCSSKVGAHVLHGDWLLHGDGDNRKWLRKAGLGQAAATARLFDSF